ncbi:MAG: hypothetical protein ABFC96_18720, partial [Thermoguttaceae bacterium]
MKTMIARALPQYALLLLLSAGLAGCTHETASETDATGPVATGVNRQELLDFAVSNLDSLEEFGSAEMLQQILDRLMKPGKSDEHFDPLLASWPEPEMLGQVVDRLNQWIHAQPATADWKADPMLAELPKPLAALRQVK